MAEMYASHPLQLAAERMFVELFKRVKATSQDGGNTIQFINALRAAKGLTQDEQFMMSLMKDLCERCDPCEILNEHGLNGMDHFHRLTMHYLALISDHQKFENPICNHWLLHGLDMLEVALGKLAFEEAQTHCTQLIESLKQDPSFHYGVFLTHPQAMIEYAALITQLAHFIETDPMHRIRWFVNAMESTPNTHVVNGLAVHVENSSVPPNEAQVGQLVTAIFEHTCHYIKNNDIDAQVSQRIPHIKHKPSVILENLHHFLVQMKQVQEQAQAQAMSAS